MVAFADRAALRASLKTWLSDPAVNDDVVNTAIALCEADISADAKLLQGEATAALTINSGSVAVPSGFRGVTGLYIADHLPMELVTLERLLEVLAVDTTGTPCYFALAGNGATALPVIMVAPTPDQTYSATLIYQKSWELTSDTAFNYLLWNHPGVYLYGALCHLRYKLQEPERLPVCEAKFAQALAAAKRDDVSQRHGAVRKRARPFYAVGSGWS